MIMNYPVPDSQYLEFSFFYEPEFSFCFNEKLEKNVAELLFPL